MNSYERKQEDRKQRLIDLADRMQSASDAAYKRARDMASIIPMGQPILVGHHSEKRDRNYRARIWRTQDRCLELQRKAEYFRQKAASVGKGGISSDDPEAVQKLRAELEQCEKVQQRMKQANAVIRTQKKNGEAAQLSALVTLGFQESRAAQLLKPDFCGRIGFPDYAMTNNNGNMRRIRERIAQLEAKAGQADQPDREHECAGFRVVECFADNRVRVFFPGKPSDAVRSLLKSHGFRWSPDAGAWQRMLNGGMVEWLTRTDDGGYLRKQLEALIGGRAA